ncbi:Arc family DNA-binding protein [Streptomyces sp. NPDC001165]
MRFSLRIPADLHERVTAQAAADRRSLNSEILHLLEVTLAPRADA